MKYLMTLLLATSLIACGAQTEGNSKFTDISEEAARELIANTPNLQILDVRTDDEVAKGMIKGATQIDFLYADFEAEAAKLDKTAPILVYCAAGGRSKDAQQKLEKMGFSEVHNLVGGYMGWSK